MSPSTLDERLARGDVIILDGATGTEIERRGVPMDAQAWSAAATLTHPDVVRSVHEDYIQAGADVIIANTFSTARCHLEAAGLVERVAEVNRRAVELARDARDRAAGCCSPALASLVRTRPFAGAQVDIRASASQTGGARRSPRTSVPSDEIFTCVGPKSAERFGVELR